MEVFGDFGDFDLWFGLGNSGTAALFAVLVGDEGRDFDRRENDRKRVGFSILTVGSVLFIGAARSRRLPGSLVVEGATASPELALG